MRIVGARVRGGMQCRMGLILVRPKIKSITDLAGFLRSNAPNIDVNEINPWPG